MSIVMPQKPMADARKKRALEAMNSIREILFRDWDPIGINENQNLSDEYDSYIGSVYKLLAERASAEEIAKMLYKAEHELGMPAKSADHLIPIAQKLLALEVTSNPNVA